MSKSIFNFIYFWLDLDAPLIGAECLPSTSEGPKTPDTSHVSCLIKMTGNFLITAVFTEFAKTSDPHFE